MTEPERDSSGYRRYTAGDAIDLLKIRILAESGVPLARIRVLKENNYQGLPQAVHEIDEELTERIRALRVTRRRLRGLADSDTSLLPPEVTRHVQRMQRLGFSTRWIGLQTDLWILVYATHPEAATSLFKDQEPAYGDPALGQIFLDYDRAYDLLPDDPKIITLANTIVAATQARYGADAPPARQGPTSHIPALIQQEVNAMSPAWERLDTLIRAQLELTSTFTNTKETSRPG